MTGPILVFFLLVVSMTAAVVLWAANLRLLRVEASPFPKAALFPVLTPVHSWRHGGRYLPVLFVLAVGFYLLGWVIWLGTGVP